DVKGVWCHEASASHFLTVVAIKQRYPGHARQAGMIATFCQSGGSTGRFIVVVDDDVDITNLEEVIWVMGSRCDPVKDIEIVRDCWSSTLDPIIPKEEKGLSSRAIIDACRPFKWMDSFPAIVGASPELEKKTVAKWGKLIYG
ncbi:MAG: UbiD family decarboxylase, partial [Dehalococcoidia bacterium]|nr:UbiD family decarboxylase [Dehalococcoidia bacterium]